MKKFLCSLAAATVFSLAAAEKPYLSFDFEKYNKLKAPSLRVERFQNPDKERSTFLGTIVPQAGVNNSVALACTGKAAWCSRLPMDWESYTIDLAFKLTKGIDSKRHSVLFAYSADENFTRRMIVWITPKGQVEVIFQIMADRKKILKSCEIISPVIKWQNNRFYSLRLTGVSGGKMTLFLDGKVIAEGEKALSFSDLQKKGEPLFSQLYFGYYPFRGPRNKPGKVLNGFMDDIKLYNKAAAVSSASDGVSSAASAPVSAAPHLLLDNSWSSPFIVGDLPGKLLGTFVRADEKFHQNAARVRLRADQKNLIAEFDCPVPAGMTAESIPKRMWSGRSDRVEMFLQPDPAGSRFYQYAAAVNGETYAGINTTANPSSKAKFAVKKTAGGYSVTITVPLQELGIRKLVPGKVLKGNFIRVGKTAGRHSYWAPVGDTYQSPENFAVIICGTRKAYFEQKYALLKKEFSTLKTTPAFNKETAAVEKMISKEGDDPQKFNALDARLTALDFSVAQLRFDGAKQLIWQTDMWANNINVSRLSRPLKSLKLRMARNSRKTVGFVVSNLENTPFLGQVKVFKHWPFTRPRKQQFSYQREWDGLLANITIHEGIGTKDESGKTLYDVLSPLPLNTLLRIPPKSSAPVWLEISSKGLAPGRYTGFVVLKNCGGQGGFESVQLDVEISPADTDEVHLDQMVYNSVQSKAWHLGSIRRFFRKNHYNYLELIPGNGLYIYWKKAPGGKLIPGDLAQLDRFVDQAASAGYDIKKLKFFFCLGWNYGLGGSYDRNPELWKKIMAASIPAWLDHLEKKYGIPHEHIILNPVDEPGGNVDDPKSNNGKAYIWSKFIKKVAPRAKVLNNPHRSGMEVYRRLAEYTDIFCFYRPDFENKKDFLKYMYSLSQQGKEIWTYNILMKNTHPETYRLDYWRNRRDGFNAVTTFWDLNSHAGGDGFDPNDVTDPKNRRIKRTDYGMVYADCNYGTILVSRRFEAAQQGYQDSRLMALCCQKIASLKKRGTDTSLFEKELKEAIEKGCRGASMAHMDAQAEVILRLAEKLIKLDNSKK
ncbi:MAG: hypothetical protein IKC65_08035 [Lentisphaeria bacterium]|nr:hypothetical protein [Lentisphaeria bacterium]